MLSVRAELNRARLAVAREYVRRHGRLPGRRLVDELLAGAWYRLSDDALAALYRAMRRRGQDC